MPPDLTPHIRIADVGDVTVVGFTGPNIFHTSDVEELNRALTDLVETQHRSRLLLNLEGVQYLSSSMLVNLINLSRRIEKERGTLKLCGLSAVLRDTFRVSKLDRYFEIFPGESEALARF